MPKLKLPVIPEKIAAFDPGDSTGLVVIVDGKISEARTIGYADFFQEACNHGWFDCPEFVCEQFRLYPWKANSLGFDGLIPVRVIGAIELLAAQQGKHVEFVDAVTAKKFCTDNRLREVGWWSYLQTPHEKDAARHALYYLTVRRPKRTDGA